MTQFFRYPHTPHLAWLGLGMPRDDKVFAQSERSAFLDHVLIVEEKVDGANIGFSVGDLGELLIQNRGSYLERTSVTPQFKTLFRWADTRKEVLIRHLGPDRILFGEWCYAVHSIRYEALPDWFLAFDVYDRGKQSFLEVGERDAFVRRAGLDLVPRLGFGSYTIAMLTRLLGMSTLGAARAEGLYLRRADSPSDRAKLVAPEFAQAIGEHWARRQLQTNALAEGMTWL